MPESLSVMPVGLLVVLVLLGVAQLTLDVIALVSLYRRPIDQVALGNKWVWVAIIALVSLLGAILYLVAGRRAAPVTESAERRAPSSSAPPEAIADALYGPRVEPDHP